MREDAHQVRHYLLILRRIIILVLVIIATPVILWTITALVRAYVAPPKVPTFRQLANTGEAPANANLDAGNLPQSASAQGTLSNSSAATAEARPRETEARIVSASSKEPLAADRLPNAGANMSPNSTKVIDASPLPASAKATDMPAAPESAASNGGGAATQQTAAIVAPPADSLPTAMPLAGPIPLPRHRPNDLVMVQINAANVPMPRPRPDSPAPTTSDSTPPGPLDLLQNLFH